MLAVSLDNVSYQYDSNPVIGGLSIGIEAGQLLTLLGPSGCGKTTLLKLIGGYLAPSDGRIFLRGRDVTHLPPEKRNVGMVFQNYALFPHLSAYDNVSFGLDMRRIPRAERDRRVNAMLDRVGLSAAECRRKPAALSGGQQQRVALARALIIEPDVLLLDEPLSNLDRHLREQLRADLRTLQRDTNVTAILVTHDQEEALAISDQIGVMRAGYILQSGSPADMYARPRTPFVARLLGPANLLPGEQFGFGDTTVMIRPEHCLLNPQLGADDLSLAGCVTNTSFLGAGVLVDVKCDNGVSLQGWAQVSPAIGDRVTVGILKERIWVIPEQDRGTEIPDSRH